MSALSVLSEDSVGRMAAARISMTPSRSEAAKHDWGEERRPMKSILLISALWSVLSCLSALVAGKLIKKARDKYRPKLQRP
jgi:hypothetical protein